MAGVVGGSREQRSKPVKHPLIVRLGAEHSFGDELLEVEREHVQVAQHPDTHAVLLQVLPTRTKRGSQFTARGRIYIRHGNNTSIYKSAFVPHEHSAISTS